MAIDFRVEQGIVRVGGNVYAVSAIASVAYQKRHLANPMTIEYGFGAIVLGAISVISWIEIGNAPRLMVVVIPLTIVAIGFAIACVKTTNADPFHSVIVSMIDGNLITVDFTEPDIAIAARDAIIAEMGRAGGTTNQTVIFQSGSPLA